MDEEDYCCLDLSLGRRSYSTSPEQSSIPNNSPPPPPDTINDPPAEHATRPGAAAAAAVNPNGLIPWFHQFRNYTDCYLHPPADQYGDSYQLPPGVRYGGSYPLPPAGEHGGSSRLPPAIQVASYSAPSSHSLTLPSLSLVHAESSPPSVQFFQQSPEHVAMPPPPPPVEVDPSAANVSRRQARRAAPALPPVQFRFVAPSRIRQNHKSAIGEGKSETIEPPFPWSTDRRAVVHSISHLQSLDIAVVTGHMKCKHCHAREEVTYDIRTKFREVLNFMRQHHPMMERAPAEWMNPKQESCRSCGHAKSMEAEIAEKRRKINWLFMFLGQMVGSCSLDHLRYFLKHNNRIHRTGAKSRVVYYTYDTIRKQLDPPPVQG